MASVHLRLSRDWSVDWSHWQADYYRLGTREADDRAKQIHQGKYRRRKERQGRREENTWVLMVNKGKEKDVGGKIKWRRK